MIGYRHLLGILPLLCGVDQVMIPGPESHPTLIFLNTRILGVFSELYCMQFASECLWRFPRQKSPQYSSHFVSSISTVTSSGFSGHYHPKWLLADLSPGS
jgi:hypothetical protein